MAQLPVCSYAPAKGLGASFELVRGYDYKYALMSLVYSFKPGV